VEKFLATNVATTARDLKWLCFGATDLVGEYCESILTDATAFRALLRQVNAVIENPRLFRKCYQGLLHAYFGFDGLSAEAQSTRANWEALRGFLASNLSVIQQSERVPNWVTDLSRHENLLGREPCARYGPALLKGDDSELEAIRRELSISESSWILREALLGAVSHAIALDGGRFRESIAALIELLNKHVVIQAPGLAAVLQRYSRLAFPDFHPGLHSFSIELWGNPLLAINQPRWHIVGDEATRMVTRWLKDRLIEDFFELLSADGKTDRSRVAFWKRYRDSISDMFFALGSEAMHSRKQDFVQLRKTMGSSLLRLEGGLSSNNAFLMVMNGFVVMEFGQKGNAAFIFNRKNLPFQLSGSILQTGKSNWPYISRLLHYSAYANGDTWQDDFEKALRRDVGVVPDDTEAGLAAGQKRGGARGAANAASDQGDTALSARRSVEAQLKRLNDRLARFSVYAIEQDDEFVVSTGRKNVPLNALLLELGFKFAPPKRWTRSSRK
jgi:hypothetical protein